MLTSPPLQPSLSPLALREPARRGTFRTWLPYLPLLLAACLYLGASTGPALFDQNEAQYAGAVREMMDRPGDYLPAARGALERGHWYIPTNDGIPRLQKPPFVYWALLASMRVCGVNEFGARLPNALASLLWFWGIYLIGCRLGGRALGRAAATILATMAGTFIFCHLIAPEPFLAAALTWTFWCFLRACEDPGRAGRWMFGAWVAMTLGTGCKGLHGALYPLAVAAILAWRHPATRPVWRKLLQPWGPLFLAAALVPWYAAVAARYPGFLYDQFVNEQWGHVINRRYPRDSDPVPLPAFALEHLVFFLPWTLYLPAAWRARTPRGQESGVPAIARDLILAWFLVTVASVLFSSLQDYYLLTAWGPVALWLARPWADDHRVARRLPRGLQTAPGVCLAALGLAALGTAAWLQWRAGLPVAAGGMHSNVERATVLATLAGFTVETWRQLVPLVCLTGVAFLAGGTASAFLAATGRWRAVLPVTALMMMAVLALAAHGLNVLEDRFSLKRIALAANRLAGPDGIIADADLPSDDPSQLFYLDRPMVWVDRLPTAEFASRELGIGADLFLSPAEFGRRWHSGQPVCLIVEQQAFPRWQRELALTPEQARPVMTRGTRVLLYNHPGDVRPRDPDK